MPTFEMMELGEGWRQFDHLVETVCVPARSTRTVREIRCESEDPRRQRKGRVNGVDGDFRCGAHKGYRRKTAAGGWRTPAHIRRQCRRIW